ncbi:MAG TPA: glucose-6-phosphate dehydrogenase [Anaerolineales bacterium]|nr:glucose-6-phosphate dehydrogenase [Anaerolineales bacterium]
MPNEPGTTLVIFGASGDLTRRKLVPSLFGLFGKGRLPDSFQLLGVARSEATDDAFRSDMRRAVLGEEAKSNSSWESFASRLHYLQADLSQSGSIEELRRKLQTLQGEKIGNVLFYLAIPPQAYAEVVASLASAGLTSTQDGWRRVVIEKPFGRDLDSAHALNEAVHRHLKEDQIYRIDHYLGKETVQNILVFRFANSIFEPIWNRRYIDHVQITVAESVGVEHRGPFYDSVGVLRDVFQNHMLQLLSLAAMEPPASFQADALRNERVKVLSAVRPLSQADVERNSLRAQYEGYLQESGVAPDSQTATYAALRLFIDNWRWNGVPFYLRSGKCLADKTTQISIQFKSVPHLMFPLAPGQSIRPNAIFLCLQPDEGIHLRFEAKVPDTVSDMRTVDMDFHYAEDFGPGSIPEAYERLLLDALNGDASLYTRADSIELAWSIIDPITHVWERGAPPLAIYPRGTWGPAEADLFIAADDRTWSMGCGEHAA